ncbi:MAG: SDR family NAD(P)-dependent oxidoreductase [Rhodospirillaceae bacterium]
MSDLATFGAGINVAVFGASGGIGSALAERLSRDPNVKKVISLSRSKPLSTNRELHWLPFDLTSEDSIHQSTEQLAKITDQLHLVLVATGLLHEAEELMPERAIKSLDGITMDHLFRINATGPALIAKYISPFLSKTQKSVLGFLSARVGSISDNFLGGWYSYRASKAALHMIVKTLAVELNRTNPNTICVAMHPGTVHTHLSHPFVAGKKSVSVKPSDAALNLLTVIDNLKPHQTGLIWDWEGKEIKP